MSSPPLLSYESKKGGASDPSIEPWEIKFQNMYLAGNLLELQTDRSYMRSNVTDLFGKHPERPNLRRSVTLRPDSS